MGIIEGKQHEPWELVNVLYIEKSMNMESIKNIRTHEK